MRWFEAMVPVRMRRIALLAADADLRDMLVRLSATGVVQLDAIGAQDVAGYVAAAPRRGRVAALTGWCPAAELDSLTARMAAIGAAVVTLPQPAGVDPPTLISGDDRPAGAFTPLVTTFGIVPYRDLDPTLPAILTYVVMFGMMFGDAGHGALLLVIAALLRIARRAPFAGLRTLSPFIAAAGVTAVLFGILYGEFFGPTGLLPVLWLAPLHDPMRLLTTAICVGAALLAAAYALGIVNRWREGGARLAVYAPSGVAGAAMFLGITTIVVGVAISWIGLLVVGAALATTGLLLAVIGLFAESDGGTTGIAQTGIAAFDLVIRLGSNLVSFARLAAFGMTHAALGLVVWRGTVALTGRGPLAVIAAIAVFAVGNLLAFALEALVAAIQALRLEYYELFSRVFVDEGNPFRPWRIPEPTSEGAPC